MRASELKSNFFSLTGASHDGPVADNHQPTQKLPPYAGGESVEDSGLSDDELTPESQEVQHGEH